MQKTNTINKNTYKIKKKVQRKYRGIWKIKRNVNLKFNCYCEKQMKISRKIFLKNQHQNMKQLFK